MLAHKDNVKAIGYDTPLPIMNGRDSDVSFEATLDTQNALDGLVVKAATSGKGIYITDLVISCSSATTVDLRDADGTTVVPRMFFPATSIFSKSFKTPLKVAASKDLMIYATTATPVTVLAAGYIV